MQQFTNMGARDIETVLHPTTNLSLHREKGPLILDRGEGVYVWGHLGTALHRGVWRDYGVPGSDMAIRS
jgi:4-aminobutyrate--pyruvate transaminase